MDLFWNLFKKSGKIEYYLKYIKCKESKSKKTDIKIEG